MAGRLPEITEGANKWIVAKEESTTGVRLALGDIKVLLMHIVGKHVTEDSSKPEAGGHREFR